MSAQLQLFEARESTDRWAVRISRRARRLSVRVYPGGRVEVVTPPGVPAAAVQRFVGVHRQWIDRRIEDLSGSRDVLDERLPGVINLPAIGRCFTLRYLSDNSTPMRVRLSEGDEGLTLRGPVHDERTVAAALREWLMKFALQELSRQLAIVAQRGAFRFRRVQIRRQRTRWGSCSASGTISLNVCVLFLDPAVMRYLLIHELSHTQHMNHSKRFWSLVESQEPEYRRLDRELVIGWRCVPAWVFG